MPLATVEPVQMNRRQCLARRGSVPGYFYLSVAICSEVAGTLALRYTHGFMKLLPSFIAIFAYSLALYMLSLALRNIPLGIAYAIWSGIVTAIVAIAGTVLFG